MNNNMSPLAHRRFLVTRISAWVTAYCWHANVFNSARRGFQGLTQFDTMRMRDLSHRFVGFDELYCTQLHLSLVSWYVFGTTRSMRQALERLNPL